MLIAATLLYARFGHGWPWFFTLFLVPDVSLLGYLAGKRLGAGGYNAVHTYTAPLLLVAFLVATGRAEHLWITLVWAAHLGIDRMLGFGLKYETGAKDTHLNRV